MSKTSHVRQVAYVVLVALILVSFLVGSGVTAMAQRKSEEWTLVGRIEKAVALVQTDVGEQEVPLEGQIQFSSDPYGNELRVERLDLLGQSLKSERGPTGLISISLLPGARTESSAEEGYVRSEFQATLHYELIDEILGYYTPQREEQPHNFLSYRETMRGTLEGRFAGPLKPGERETTEFEGTLVLQLDEAKLAVLIEWKIYVVSIFWWERVFGLVDTVCIQPVFVRSGPSDSSPTGSSFNTMMSNAAALWAKCCVFFDVKPPIYVNNSSYKVLSGQTEAEALKAEHSNANCIEIFVADRFDPVWDGGGACWAGGTAAAKIVTCDQQLSIPCGSGTGECAAPNCGALNQNHLAHEIGHALNLLHPGTSWTGMIAGSSGSVMAPSGWCADNPSGQSTHNCDSASNPLTALTLVFEPCSYNVP
ncbi:hypothetical protein ACFLS5_04850 [Candidatus Bipolaricaulota bacterium]